MRDIQKVSGSLGSKGKIIRMALCVIWVCGDNNTPVFVAIFKVAIAVSHNGKLLNLIMAMIWMSDGRRKRVWIPSIKTFLTL